MADTNTSLAVHFSSATDQWSTPDDFFRRLDSIFSFTLDPCADDNNHKTEKYFTKEDDGLSQPWDGERVFMNPPYGRGIGLWVEKASKTKGLVVCLVPARTDTRWWQQFVLGGGVTFTLSPAGSSSVAAKTLHHSQAQCSSIGRLGF